MCSHSGVSGKMNRIVHLWNCRGRQGNRSNHRKVGKNSMNHELIILKNENKRLSQQAELDWLTGIYNRKTIEEKVNRRLKENSFGVLFVLDIDNFKSINDRYGHLMGDQVLQGVAHILQKMIFGKDILGRIGGDEFVIFMSVKPGPNFIEERCRQIKQQFLNLPGSTFMVNRLSVTVCGSIYHKGDDYQSLFDRADQHLLQEKKQNKRKNACADDRLQERKNRKSLTIDMEQISLELSEHAPQKGAFCQDYDCFVSIYRFVERRLQRVQSSVYSLLLTLTDEQGDFPDLPDRVTLMEELYEIIQQSLRAGDVFTRYSSCQYLIMVSDATDLQTDAVAERILEKFAGCSSLSGNYRILYKRYPLKPSKRNGAV